MLTSRDVFFIQIQISNLCFLINAVSRVVELFYVVLKTLSNLALHVSFDFLTGLCAVQ